MGTCHARVWLGVGRTLASSQDILIISTLLLEDSFLLKSYRVGGALRCQLIHFFENINFYIVIPPSKYDNKEILRLQGSSEGPKILRFRFL